MTTEDNTKEILDNLAVKAYEAGAAASQKAEINELKSINENLYQGQQALEERINELQKRIDYAVWLLNSAELYAFEENIKKSVEILKGQNNG